MSPDPQTRFEWIGANETRLESSRPDRTIPGKADRSPGEPASVAGLAARRGRRPECHPTWLGWSPTTRFITVQGVSWRMRFAPQAVRDSGDRCGFTSRDPLGHDLGRPHRRPLSRVLLTHFPGGLRDDRRGNNPCDGCPLKLAAALAVVQSGRRLIWTDDDAIPFEGPERALLEDRGAPLITRRPGRGMRPDDLVRIDAYLGEREHRPRE
jgi:hypothetical protein